MKYEQRSQAFESFLESLNDAASAIGEPELAGKAPISAQIVGLPRSGTTLLFQLLAMTGQVGYPSNLMALFHRAPWVGAMIQVHLGKPGGGVSLESLGGRTPGVLDPHEFGYFWRRLCGHSSNSLVQDVARPPVGEVRRELELVASVFEAPTVYKNFLAIRHVAWMRQGLPGMRFLVITRPTEDIAASLWRLRRTIGAGLNDQVGVAPTTDLGTPESSVDLVARQTVALERDLHRASLVASSDTMVTSYQDLLTEPRDVVGEALTFLGIEPGSLGQIPRRIDLRGSFAELEFPEQEALAQALHAARARVEGGQIG